MSVIFSIIVIASVFALSITEPQSVLSALTGAGTKATELFVSLLAVYTVWCGIFEIIKSCGIDIFMAKILRKPIRFIFGSADEKTKNLVSMNLSANLLGLGSVATPIGIKAEKLFENEKNKFAQSMLLIIGAAPLQLLPTTVISLREAYGASNAQDVVFPIILASTVNFVTAVMLGKIFLRK